MKNDITFWCIVIVLMLNMISICILTNKTFNRIDNINRNIIKICERNNYDYSSSTNHYGEIKFVNIH